MDQPITSEAFRSVWDGREDSELILIVNDPVGPIPSALIVRRPPLVALYSDGTVLVQSDPEERSYLAPQEFLIPLERVTLSPDMRREVDVLINNVRLPFVDSAREDRPGHFDFGTMRAEYTTFSGAQHIYEAYALSKQGAGMPIGAENGWPSAETHALGRLAALLHPLSSAEDSEPYVPERVALYLFESAGSRFNGSVPWPLPVAPDQLDLGPPLGQRRCVTLHGTALAEALPLLEQFPADRHVRLDRYGEVEDKELWMVAEILAPETPSCGTEVSRFVP